MVSSPEMKAAEYGPWVPCVGWGMSNWTLAPGLASAGKESAGKALRVGGRRAALPSGHLVMTPEAIVYI